VLAYKVPLYGRLIAQMKILPFDFKESCRYFNNLSDEEKVSRKILCDFGLAMYIVW